MNNLNFRGFALMLFAIIAFTSCEKNDFFEENKQLDPVFKSLTSPDSILEFDYSTQLLEAEVCGETKISIIYNSINVEVGQIKTSNDEEYLYIEFVPNAEWKYLTINLFVGNYDEIPLNTAMEPNVRSFPVQVRFPSLLSYVYFKFPLENLEENFVILPYIYGFKFSGSSLVGREYLWGGDSFIGNSQTARYFNFEKQECCEIIPFSYDLITNRDEDIGDLVVVNDEEYLYVTYTLSDNWYVKNMKMFVGDVNDLPMNHGGNPVVGHFPIKQQFAPGTTTFTYTYNISELPDCLVIAVFSSNEKIVNGVKVDSGSAWSYGTEFSAKKRWGWYSEYCTQFCN